MAARIRSFRNFITPVDEASRNDLVIGDVVSVTSIDAATTYAWTLVFVPEGSAAGFSGSSTAVSPGQFNVDMPGSYLVRLIVDAGLGSESEQYVRLRALTVTTPLYLVAAGERRDLTGVIPVDADAQGWADDQNRNLNSLLSLIKPLTSSANILYVDANVGTEGRADYDTVQGAIDAAVATTPSSSNQWQIVVRPGIYVENVTFAPWVHVSGDPSAPSLNFSGVAPSFAVIDGTHTITTGAGDAVVLSGLQLTTSFDTSSPTLLVSGSGSANIDSCRLFVEGVDANQGAALEVAGGGCLVRDCTLLSTPAGAPTTPVILQSDSSELFVTGCLIFGNRVAWVNPSLRPSVEASFFNCNVSYNVDGILTDARSLNVSQSDFDGNGTVIHAHPGAGAYPNDVDVKLQLSKIKGDIVFDITGIGGSANLILSGVADAGNLVFPGGAPNIQSDLKSYSVFYDNTVSGLTAENVQDAIDEVAVANITTATSNPYNVTTNDQYVLVNVVAAGAVTVNLPAGATHVSKTVVIKDRKGAGGTTTPISVVPNGAETIDGSASYSLSTNYASVTLVFSGTEWSVV